MIRAVLEGVAYSLKDCMEILREMGVRTEEMLACGGGGTSAVWRQMLADLYGCGVKTLETKEGPALGAAILAGVGAGLYDSVQSGCEKVLKVNKVQQPDLENGKVYDKYYRVYKSIYPALKGVYKELAVTF